MTPTSAMAILAAVSRRFVSGGGTGSGLGGEAVSGTPSTDFPQRHVVAGGATRRAQAGHTRLNVDEVAPGIYEKILT